MRVAHADKEFERSEHGVRIKSYLHVNYAGHLEFIRTGKDVVFTLLPGIPMFPEDWFAGGTPRLNHTYPRNHAAGTV